MNNYYVTFGQNSPAKNGWIRVIAESEWEARLKVISEYEQKWAFLYAEADFNPSYFPAGELGVLK